MECPEGSAPVDWSLRYRGSHRFSGAEGERRDRLCCHCNPWRHGLVGPKWIGLNHFGYTLTRRPAADSDRR